MTVALLPSFESAGKVATIGFQMEGIAKLADVQFESDLIGSSANHAIIGRDANVHVAWHLLVKFALDSS